MRALILALLLSLTAGSAGQETHWRDPHLGDAVVEGAATGRFLWLRGSSGAVVRFDRTSGERMVVAHDVIDLFQDGRRIWILSGAQEGFSATLRDLNDDAFAPVTRQADSRPLALIKGGQGDIPDILWADAVTGPISNPPRTDFTEAPDRLAAAASDATGATYVGYDYGEWGGGLRRIDPKSGAIAIVSEERGSCEGGLDPECEPVVGLFRDRQAPECVIVGTGLNHMGLGIGHVYRVCGTSISSVFSTPRPGRNNPLRPAKPLLSLVETRDGWVGVSEGRYFQMRGGEPEERRLPTLKDWAGLRISEEENGVLFVMYACCWGYVDNPTEYGVLAVPVAP